MKDVDSLYILSDTLSEIVSDAEKGVEQCTQFSDRLAIFLQHSILLTCIYRLIYPLALRFDVVHQANSVYETYADKLKTTTRTAL